MGPIFGKAIGLPITPTALFFTVAGWLLRPYLLWVRSLVEHRCSLSDITGYLVLTVGPAEVPHIMGPQEFVLMGHREHDTPMGQRGIAADAAYGRASSVPELAPVSHC